MGSRNCTERRNECVLSKKMCMGSSYCFVAGILDNTGKNDKHIIQSGSHTTVLRPIQFLLASKGCLLWCKDERPPGTSRYFQEMVFLIQ